MIYNFFTETCIVEGHELLGYPGATRKAYPTFSKAMLECSKGIASIFMLYEKEKTSNGRRMYHIGI